MQSRLDIILETVTDIILEAKNRGPRAFRNLVVSQDFYPSRDDSERHGLIPLDPTATPGGIPEHRWFRKKMNLKSHLDTALKGEYGNEDTEPLSPTTDRLITQTLLRHPAYRAALERQEDRVLGDRNWHTNMRVKSRAEDRLAATTAAIRAARSMPSIEDLEKGGRYATTKRGRGGKTKKKKK